MFYPLVDGDSTEQQDMINDVSLPRYTDGVGVKAFLVVTTPMTADGDVTVGYTDCDDIDRSITVRCLVGSVAVGGIIHGAAAGGAITVTRALTPFLPIPQRGIKRINYVTNAAGLGGFFAVCLCKPLASLMQREALTMTEKCLITAQLSMPRIYPGAYLNFLLFAGSFGNPSTIRGQLDFVWSQE